MQGNRTSGQQGKLCPLLGERWNGPYQQPDGLPVQHITTDKEQRSSRWPLFTSKKGLRPLRSSLSDRALPDREPPQENLHRQSVPDGSRSRMVLDQRTSAGAPGLALPRGAGDTSLWSDNTEADAGTAMEVVLRHSLEALLGPRQAVPVAPSLMGEVADV